MTLKFTLVAVAYLTLVFGTIIGCLWWLRRSNRRRQPFPENFRLMRLPGEHLLNEVRKSEDNDDVAFIFGAAFPLFTGLLAITIAKPMIQYSPFGAVAFVVLVALASIFIAARLAAKRIFKRADYYLGFIGERFVGECLEPLKLQGWYVFHDIPCDGETGKFNIDHAAVGPNGVWVIETKCVRKRKGVSDRRVYYDGMRLKWPWKEDRNGIDQASANARWLKGWLYDQTGKDVDVKAVLAFPAWEVIEQKLCLVRAANPADLPEVLTGRKHFALSPPEIDLFRRLLTDKCRNVSL